MTLNEHLKKIIMNTIHNYTKKQNLNKQTSKSAKDFMAIVNLA